MRNLSKAAKMSYVSAHTAASTATTIAGDNIDMQDYDGVVVHVRFQTLTTGDHILKVQQSPTTASTDFVDLKGATVTLSSSSTGDPAQAFVDVYKPLKRYVRGHVTRTTGVVTQSMVAWQYRARDMAVDNTAASRQDGAFVASPSTTT